MSVPAFKDLPEEQQLAALMHVFGYTERQARFALMVERGEVPGDCVDSLADPDGAARLFGVTREEIDADNAATLNARKAAA